MNVGDVLDPGQHDPALPAPSSTRPLATAPQLPRPMGSTSRSNLNFHRRNSSLLLAAVEADSDGVAGVASSGEDGEDGEDGEEASDGTEIMPVQALAQGRALSVVLPEPETGERRGRSPAAKGHGHSDGMPVDDLRRRGSWRRSHSSDSVSMYVVMRFVQR